MDMISVAKARGQSLGSKDLHTLCLGPCPEGLIQSWGRDPWKPGKHSPGRAHLGLGTVGMGRQCWILHAQPLASSTPPQT